MARNYGVTAPVAMQRDVAKLVRQLGIDAVADRLGISAQTVGRVASGARVQSTTLDVVERRLAEGEPRKPSAA